MTGRERDVKKHTHFRVKLIVSMAKIVVKPNKRPSTMGTIGTNNRIKETIL